MQLAINNIYLGDAYELIKKIPDKSIDLIYTDIPYLHSKGGNGKDSLSQRIKKKNQDISSISNGIDYKILDEFIRVCKHPYIYIWCSKLQLLDIMNHYAKYKLIFELLFWGKTNAIPTANQSYLPDVELLLMFREEKTTKLNSGCKSKSKFYISATNRADKALYYHPTIKPLEYVKNHILNSSQEGDIILDPFCGSGTTCVAAKELGRNFIGFELNPTYYQFAIDRLNGISQLDRKNGFSQLSLFESEVF